MSITAAIETRRRVIGALLSREAKKRFGGNYVGLLTAFFEPLVQVAFFGLIFYATDRQGPHGASVFPFMLTGVLPFHLFSKIMTMGMSAIDANKTLLSYPVLKPVDTVIARAILESLIYIMSFISLMVICLYLELIPEIARFEYLFFAMLFATCIGLGMGILSAAVLSLSASVKRFVPVVNRVLFLTSGVFFSASMIPQFAREYFLWNPMLNITEMARYGTFQNYPPNYFNVPFILAVVVISITAGLVVLHYAESNPKARIRGS
ncbi:ABC transporter permease [Sulfitobacter sp. R18_1]|uniref:ABC transporter permease n=1 Tax=Sulfitobacter sp. R18_1 TaxID=2821104 RepID=UPI001ADD0F2E|nr:ABC transporter permease [Sulfitobacter sp. R18_1]MBO9428597.1 ABC transporter permease [Sulfitobacter sp. R18_1]